MPKSTAERAHFGTRIIRTALATVLVVALALCSFPQAFADFGSESTDQIIGVGRIQSSTVTTTSSELAVETHFEAPLQLSEEAPEVVDQLAQPLDRGIENTEEAIANINLIQRFGVPDEGGWYTTKASAYGPSSAGQYTSLGTELTLTSMDVGCRIDHMDIMLGRYIEIMYGGQILRCRVVDTGTLTPDRHLDLQPGVCTYFGAPTPEFGWGVRTVKWRFAD